MGGGGTLISILCIFLNNVITYDINIMGLDINSQNLANGVFFLIISLVMSVNYCTVLILLRHPRVKLILSITDHLIMIKPYERKNSSYDDLPNI